MCHSVISLSHHFTLLMWDKMARQGQSCLFPPGQLGPDQTPGDEALVKHFLLRADAVKKRIFWYISKHFLFFSSSWKQEGIFLSYSLWKPGQAPGGKIHKSVGAPKTGSPWTFYLSHWACSNSSLLVQASLPYHQFPQRFQTHRFLSSKL